MKLVIISEKDFRNREMEAGERRQTRFVTYGGYVGIEGAIFSSSILDKETVYTTPALVLAALESYDSSFKKNNCEPIYQLCPAQPKRSFFKRLLFPSYL